MRIFNATEVGRFFNSFYSCWIPRNGVLASSPSSTSECCLEKHECFNGPSPIPAPLAFFCALVITSIFELLFLIALKLLRMHIAIRFLLPLGSVKGCSGLQMTWHCSSVVLNGEPSDTLLSPNTPRILVNNFDGGAFLQGKRGGLVGAKRHVAFC